MSTQRDSKRAGDAWEGAVLGQVSILKARGQCYAWKCPDPVKIMGRINTVRGKPGIFRKIANGKLVFGRTEKHVFVDYFGLMKGGKFFAFDCKHQYTQQDRWSWGELGDQCRTLGFVASFGAPAFFYVRRTDIANGRKVTDYVFPVDPGGFPCGIENRKSIRWDQASAYAVKPGDNFFHKMNEIWI